MALATAGAGKSKGGKVIDLKAEQAAVQTDVLGDLAAVGAWLKLQAEIPERKAALEELLAREKEARARRADLEAQIAAAENERTEARAAREIAQRAFDRAADAGNRGAGRLELMTASDRVYDLDALLRQLGGELVNQRNRAINARIDAKAAAGDLAQIEAMPRPATPALDLLRGALESLKGQA